MADIPHFRYPFQRDPLTGKVGVVEQDTEEHIVSCEQVIASFPAGSRSARPEFGWTFPTFRTAPLDPAELQTALRRFEPRSDATVEEVADLVDFVIRHLQVTLPVPGDGNG